MIERFRQWILFRSIKWWLEERMDQWERWKFKTKYGTIYVRIDHLDDGYHHEEIKV